MTLLPGLMLLAALAPGQQATGAPPPATPPPAPAKPAVTAPQTPAPSTPAAKPGSIDLTVTGPSGMLLADAAVHAEGPSSREGTTSGNGEVILTNVAAGTYRVRVQKDGFITLEKELVVKASTRTAGEAMLSPAPPPPAPPPPPPAPTPVAPTLVAGSPVTISLVDQTADELLKSKEPIAERALGCSGATAAKLVRLKDALPSHTHADADEMLYVVAGEATLTMNGKDQIVQAGWFGLIPRGMSHAVKVRGGKPLLLLSVQSGPACASNGPAGAK